MIPDSEDFRELDLPSVGLLRQKGDAVLLLLVNAGVDCFLANSWLTQVWLLSRKHWISQNLLFATRRQTSNVGYEPTWTISL